jgi:putative membrane protein
MMWWNGDWSWWAWVGMTVTMLAFWGLIAWAVVAFVRSTGDTSRRGPEVLLAERFAAGEIDEDEYNRRLEVLKDHEVPAQH